MHNLRGVDVDIPRDSLVVITGVSGSGKSSLAFDTLFAEGQRRYLESLSTYTRQYLNQLQRPDVDSIDGLPPTVSIDQRSASPQPRSTLATTTEIYDYLRLLYARAGQSHCPECCRPVAQQSSQQIVSRILEMEDKRKVMILAPLVQGRRGMHRPVFEQIGKEGFVRARVDGVVVDAADPPELAKAETHTIEAVVDRIIVKEGIRARLQESIDLALKHGDGACVVSHLEGEEWRDCFYSEKFACADCGISFPHLEPRTFSFNSPYGACEQCEGLGLVDGAAKEDEADEIGEGIVCSACDGGRLNPFARAVTLAGVPIHELTNMPVADALQFVEQTLNSIESDSNESTFSTEARLVIAKTLPDVCTRLQFLSEVGLDYLRLNRPTRSLSGGEFQRSQLASCLGSGLIGVCYVLDEPTIGLHPRDVGRLIRSLEELRDVGNSVVVVDHDLEIMNRSDCLIDLGPGAGSEGGQLIAFGSPDEVAQNPASVTGRYLAANGSQPRRNRSRQIDDDRTITLRGATRNNLKNVTVRIPLNALSCITGVSGSGKSSLIAQTLAPAIRHALQHSTAKSVDFKQLEGVEQIDRIVEIDQSPIGRSGRSTPATYSGVWDEVRKVFARTREARIRGYAARRFSFNSREGRCPTCSGHGIQTIEMHFMPAMHVTCPDCRGARFNRQTLGVRFAGKHAADILSMRIDEAAELFEHFPKLQKYLRTFEEVGLGYLGLGQSSLTLSGGEAQRVKLATELSRQNDQHTLFVLDEPTTGLHSSDIEKLMSLLNRLVENNNTVIVVEHQLDVIAAADWIIDLGPEGGDAGGQIVAEGTPETTSHVPSSHTGAALRKYLSATKRGN